MKEKIVIVTGSTSGIGLGIARIFAQEGARLLVNGFGEPSAIEQELHSLRTLGATDVHYNGNDLSDASGCQQLIQQASDTWGRLDILINNAGIQHVAPIETFPQHLWEKILAVNLSAAFYTIQAALPIMLQHGYGRIINIASAHGLVASPFKSAYVAAKHGIVGLTKTVALETATQNITCNAICPGWVLTPLVKKQIDQRALEKGMSWDEAKADLLLEKQPSGDFVHPDQIGQTALFLCSPAATQITGTSLSIDGGWTAR
jgi:3-hydroxybutyrate dehydrogenase